MFLDIVELDIKPRRRGVFMAQLSNWRSVKARIAGGVMFLADIVMGEILVLSNSSVQSGVRPDRSFVWSGLLMAYIQL